MTLILCGAKMYKMGLGVSLICEQNRLKLEIEEISAQMEETDGLVQQQQYLDLKKAKIELQVRCVGAMIN